ncbi:peptidyl-prolyl cis-trans isomerase, EpsD family [Nitrosomonas sp. JL21]|nr:EpsD family peptidyl-prolyl cis-trans isomerase [Nitrosomonas sp.]MXS77378.1 peptidyl-prolyl cis-trans isomerase, EpsD family [Nitrosomonas sp. JL21]
MVLANTQMKLICLALISVLALGACNNHPKERKSGQALVSVDGHEITLLQLNDEIKRAGIRVDQHENVSKQLLESLIARQLIVDEAVRNKLDRTPDVMQARERAIAQITAQAYLHGMASKMAKPSDIEIKEYFEKHPELFSERKQFDLTILRLASKDMDHELKARIDGAKSVNEVVAWLDKKNIQYSRNSVSRNTSDLPAEMAKLLQEKGQDHLIIVNEQEHGLIISVTAMRDNPISFKTAAQQIERYLANQKYKQATDAEISRLRSLAKIEYLNAKAPQGDAEKSNAQSSVLTPEAANNSNSPQEPVSEGFIERGIMGLK